MEGESFTPGQICKHRESKDIWPNVQRVSLNCFQIPNGVLQYLIVDC